MQNDTDCFRECTYIMELPQEDGCILNLHVLPGSSENQLIEILNNGILKIKLTAPPVENQANRLLIEFLAKKLKLKKTQIKFLHGKKSKNKQVIVKKISKIDLDKVVRDAISRTR